MEGPSDEPLYKLRSDQQPTLETDPNKGRYRYVYYNMREMRMVTRDYTWDARLERQKREREERKEAWAERQREKQEIKDKYEKAQKDLPLAREAERIASLKDREFEIRRDRLELECERLKKEFHEETDEAKKAEIKQKYKETRQEWKKARKEKFDTKMALINAEYDTRHAVSGLEWARYMFESTFPPKTK
jgi:hypothetical protein